jgi:hypothetical protein
MKNLIDPRMTAALVVALSVLWGACASRTSHAPDASGSRTEVAHDDLVIRRVLLAVPGESNIDVTAEARPFLESSGKVKVTPDLFVPQPNPDRKKSTGVGVFYILRGKPYCFSAFHIGQEFSRAALLKDALAQERNEPTFLLRKRDDKTGQWVFVELRPAYTRLSTPNRGSPEAPFPGGQNQAWFLKKDGTLLKQRSVAYFVGGTGKANAISWNDEFEFDPTVPEEVCALTVFNGSEYSAFGISPKDWKRERDQPGSGHASATRRR